MYNHQSPLPATLFSSLYEFYERAFLERLSKLESKFDAPKIQAFLKDVLAFNKDSMLSYTASPKSLLNQRILALAHRLAHQKQTHPLCILRPDLSTECIQNPDQKKPGTSIYPNLNDPQVLVETILSQYISGDPGRTYWIPVKILAECSIQESTHKLPNYYCDFALPEEQRGTGYLTESEVQRLYHFSPQTLQLWELRKNYAKLLESDLSLLAQLNILLKNMRFNSKAYGHGIELDAGLGAYLALIRFLEYYKPLRAHPGQNIPEEIIREIEFLFQITSNIMVNTNAMTETQTCMSLRYDRLFPLVQHYKETLAGIYPQGAQAKGDFLLQIEQDYQQIQNDLIVNFQQGHDPLGVSVPLVALCQNHIQILSESDLHLFLNSCPEKEYARLLGPQATHKNLRQSILWVLRANNLHQLIPNLVILLVELQPQKGRAFLAEFPEIIDKLNQVPMAFSEVLLSFEGEKFRALLEGLSPSVLLYYLGHSEELEDSSLFSEDKRKQIHSETMRLADSAQDFASFMKIAPFFKDETNNGEFIQKVGLEKLVSFVTDGESFRNIDLNIHVRSLIEQFREKGMEKLVSLTIDKKSFWKIFERISNKSLLMRFVSGLKLKQLVSFITDAHCFNSIASNLSDEDLHNQFLNEGIEKLSSLVTDAHSFNSMASIISNKSYQNRLITALETEKLVSFVTDVDSFNGMASNLLECPSHDHFRNKGIEKLSFLVTDAQSFHYIAARISDAYSHNQFLDKGIEKLASLITDARSFSKIAPFLPENHTKKLIENLGFEKLSYFVIDADSFLRIASQIFDKDLRNAFIREIKIDTLVSFATDSWSFNNIAQCLEKDCRSDFMEKGLNKISSLVTDNYSFNRILGDLRLDCRSQFIEKMTFNILETKLRDSESIFILQEIVGHYRKEGTTLEDHFKKKFPGFFEESLQFLLNNKEGVSILFSRSSKENTTELASPIKPQKSLRIFPISKTAESKAAIAYKN